MAFAAPVALAMSAIGGVIQGAETNRAARASARVDEQNARLTVLQGEQEVMQTRRDERRMAGDMMAALGGAGVMLGTGTAADLFGESAYQRELEVYNIRTTRSQEATDLSRRASESRKAGRAALVSSVFGAVGQVLGGVETMRARNSDRRTREAERQYWERGHRPPRPSFGG